MSGEASRPLFHHKDVTEAQTSDILSSIVAIIKNKVGRKLAL